MILPKTYRLGLTIAILVAWSSITQGEDLRKEAAAGMLKAAKYYHGEVAVEGGYVYHYTLDLKTRWGEGLATEKQIWVQPPATPTVGMAFLEAYEATGNEYYLNAAQDAALALVYGQLRGGGWERSIDMRWRAEGFPFSGGKKRREGNCSLDDDQTQAAIRLLCKVDAALQFKHEEIHQASLFALDSLLKAQFDNGAFPQVWREPVSKQPVLKASHPKYDWRSEGRVKNYWDYYTINDGVPGDVADALIVAHQTYEDERYLTALERLGDFLILAQMPDPQPAWAQQYNYQMHPIWARKFEPAAIAGDESQEVIAALLTIAESTGDVKYLGPIPRAIAYLRKSQLKDGQLARYYELNTNKPLYMWRRGKEYHLTYDDSQLPSHYSWKNSSRLDKLQAEYERIKAKRPVPARNEKNLEARVRQILDGLDDQGRWITTYDGQRLVGQAKFQVGDRYLSSEQFSRNIVLISGYLQSHQ